MIRKSEINKTCLEFAGILPTFCILQVQDADYAVQKWKISKKIKNKKGNIALGMSWIPKPYNSELQQVDLTAH